VQDGTVQQIHLYANTNGDLCDQLAVSFTCLCMILLCPCSTIQN